MGDVSENWDQQPGEPTPPPASYLPYGTPEVPEAEGPVVPTEQPSPYAPPVPHQPYGAQPCYGAAFGATHQRATTALVLGIISVVAPFLGCIFFPTGIVSVATGIPAIVIGSRAMREIDQSPTHYTNRGSAVGGLVLGIIGTTLGALSSLLIIWFIGAFWVVS